MMDDLDFTDFLSADDTELEFSIGDFSLTNDREPRDARYVKPKFSTVPITVSYNHAADLARAVRLAPGEQIHGIVSGNFIFGDFIEALLVEKDAICKAMHVATLSLSQGNIDSFAGLLDSGRVKTLVLIVSNYFYSHERSSLMPYMLAALDKEDRFDCLIARNHTKIVLMEISNLRLILSGSSNLRSSRSIEQFVLQESPELYAFYLDWFAAHAGQSIIDKEKPHEHPIRERKPVA